MTDFANKWMREMMRPANDDELLDGVMKKGEIIWFDTPLKAKDIICPMCGGKDKFVIKNGDKKDLDRNNEDRKISSCANDGCIQLNKGKSRYDDKKKDLTNMHLLGIPEAYKNSFIGNIEINEKDRKSIINFVENPGCTICSIFSSKGNATELACAALSRRYGIKGSSCCFYSFYDLLACTKGDSQYEINTRMRVKNFDFIVLDNLNCNYPKISFWFLDDLLHRRTQNNLKTIITLSSSSKEVMSYFGKDIYNKIFSGLNINMDK